MPHKDPEKRAAYKRQWYEKNRAKLLSKAKTYREANPESVAATKKRCYDRNMANPSGKPNSAPNKKRCGNQTLSELRSTNEPAESGARMRSLSISDQSPIPRKIKQDRR